jgi:predicted  nucleic acid-binding Zn-ribbon protein
MPHQCTNCTRVFDDGSKEMLSGCPDCGGNKFQFQPESGAFDDTTGEPDTAETQSDGPPAPDRTRPDRSVAETVGSAAATVRDLVGGSSTSDPGEPTPASAGADAQPTTSASEAPDRATAEAEYPAADTHRVHAEDTAQADARSQVVEPDELPQSDGFTPSSSGPERDPASPTSGHGGEPAADPAGETLDSGTQREATTRSAVDRERTDQATGDRTGLEQSAPERDVDRQSTPDRDVVDEPDAERGDRPDLAELREELNDQFESIRVVERGQYELNLMELYDRNEYIIALQEDGRYSIQMPGSLRDDA